MTRLRNHCQQVLAPLFLKFREDIDIEATLTHYQIWKLKLGESLDHQTTNNQRRFARCGILMVFLERTALGVRTTLEDQNGRFGVADTLSTVVEKRD